MAAPLFFEPTKPDDGIIYYIIPAGTSLFRGDIPPNYKRPLDHISGPVFFGQTADVALTYGIPFEFKTKSELRLLALDKSMKTIYENASKDQTLIDGEPVKEVIPLILKRNYGYNGGVRNSDDAADKKLTKYICKNFPGYATDFMETDFGGDFHREIVICDKNNVNFVSQLTTLNGNAIDEAQIKAEQNQRKVAQQVADARKQAKEESKKRKADLDNDPPIDSANKLSFDSDSDEEGGPYAIPSLSSVKKLSFDSDSDEEGGGKSRKRTKSHKKQMRNKRRKTHKKRKQKRATHKRK
jgi:hypothetical protein